MWNVNQYLRQIDAGAAKGFNRNIVECKFPGVATKSPYDVVLIETLWNVNGDGEGAEKAMKRVLIETLWNVNGIMV